MPVIRKPTLKEMLDISGFEEGLNESTSTELFKKLKTIIKAVEYLKNYGFVVKKEVENPISLRKLNTIAYFGSFTKEEFELLKEVWNELSYC